MVKPITKLVLLALRSSFAIAWTISPSWADTEGDDYVACLIGRAAVALHRNEKDSSGALEVAFKKCKPSKKISENELEGISDFANMMIEKMASK